MTRCLKKEGFDVEQCASGDEALQLAKAYHPALITLDVIMPGMDGWAVLRSLKDDPETQDIPVIMATIIDDGNMGYALGASEFVTKPIQRDRLASVVQKYRCPDPSQCLRASYPVLLIDDDADQRDLLRRMIENVGWSVVEAENGKEGLQRVAECQPRLILLDLMMPEMDGFEFVHHLRETEAGRHTPVIVLTSKDMTNQENQVLNDFVERVMQKGAYRRDELLDEVRRIGARCAQSGETTICQVCNMEITAPCRPNISTGQDDTDTPKTQPRQDER